MTEVTPGPWFVGDAVETHHEAEYVEIKGTPFTRNAFDYKPLIAKVIFGEQLEHQMVNARLIAAAPELLEALKDAVEAIEGLGCHPSCTDAANEAIAKATTPEQ